MKAEILNIIDLYLLYIVKMTIFIWDSETNYIGVKMLKIIVIFTQRLVALLAKSDGS